MEKNLYKNNIKRFCSKNLTQFLLKIFEKAQILKFFVIWQLCIKTHTHIIKEEEEEEINKYYFYLYVCVFMFTIKYDN